jgi:hypothetical protein
MRAIATLQEAILRASVYALASFLPGEYFHFYLSC